MEIVMERMETARINSRDWVVQYEEQYEMVIDMIHQAIHRGEHPRIFVVNPGMWRWFDSLPCRYEGVTITRN